MSSSNVGSSGMYEDGDQKNYSREEEQKMKESQRYEEGQPKSHNQLDSKDERSIANKLAAESKKENETEKDSFETELLKQDATKPAKMHGNEPSKGAKIDQELQEEEEEMLKKKGAFGPSASN